MNRFRLAGAFPRGLLCLGAHVRTAVFTSGSLLTVPLWQLTPVHAQQSFDHLAARCAATPGCARAYHPVTDLAAVASRLRAHPARVTITGPSGRRETVTITLTAFLNLVVGYYLSPPGTAVLLPPGPARLRPRPVGQGDR